MLEARSPLPRGQQWQRHFQPFDGHVICGHCNCALTPTYTKKQGRKYCYYICSRLNKNADHDCPVKRVPAGDLEHAVVSMLSGLFQPPSILRETLKAVRHKEELLRKNCERDVELLQAQLDEMKKQALKEGFNFEEVKKAADLLAEAKRKRNLLREPVSEDEVIAALGDAAGLWEFMFTGARHELLQLIVGDIVVYPDRISFVLEVDGLKDLASEMAVSGYFNEPPGSRRETTETDLAPPGDQQRATLDGQADQRRGDERHRPVKATRAEGRLRHPHPFPEQSCPRAVDPGRLERAATALRLSDTVTLIIIPV